MNIIKPKRGYFYKMEKKRFFKKEYLKLKSKNAITGGGAHLCSSHKKIVDNNGIQIDLDKLKT